jgi:hypothetical protein
VPDPGPLRLVSLRRLLLGQRLGPQPRDGPERTAPQRRLRAHQLRHRIIAGAGEPGPTDCNNNGTPDLCEIRDGLVADVNNDRIPDSCQCLADFDGSGFSDSDDFVAFVSVFTLGCTAPGVPVPECDRSADFDNSGFVDSDDFTTFVTVFTVGC